MGSVTPSAAQSRLDLHCHSADSFDGSVPAARLVELALRRRLTHLAVTDHETLAGAVRARQAGADGLTVIIAQETRTTEGDLIALFVAEPIPAGLSVIETAWRIHEQGGLVGLAHPFDVRRPSVGRGAVRPEQWEQLATLVDYVEVHNGRVLDPAANARAADFARTYGVPPVAVSDAHTEDEIGTVATVVDGPIDTAEELLRALRTGTGLIVREPARPSGADALHRLMARLRGSPAQEW